MTEPPAYTCPLCGATSHGPDDIANRYCGRCHKFLADALRMRLYVGGQLADEVWLTDLDEAGRVSERHQSIAADADRAGQSWLIEVYDPAKPERAAYVRFGTDKDGMVAPYEVERWPWEETP
jgi:hypothetical protein